MPENKIICGAMPEATKELPDGSINCCISSPPYWALRDYGTAIWEGGNPNCSHEVGRFKYKVSDKQKSNTGSAGHQARDICPHCGAKRTDKQLGLEPTFEEYIDKLCTIYDEVKRVLRKDGTCWVNIADTYWGGKGQSGQGSPEYQEARQDVSINKPASHVGGQKLTRPQDMQHDTIQAKSLCLIPQRFAIEMVNRGWILRNVIIWHKPNPMPSSAKDRFTVDFEYIYFFTKQKKYWFEPQYEPMQDCSLQRFQYEYGYNDQAARDKVKASSFVGNREANPLGRNKRTVWTIPTQSFPDAHFATFPEKLVEPMIKAGCPEFVCTKCGKGREKVYQTEDIKRRRKTPTTKPCDDRSQSPNDYGGKEIIGYEFTDCGCNADWRPGIVLDCFCRQLYHWSGCRKIA